MYFKKTPPAFEIPIILYSCEQFKAWYLARTDLSMFSRDEINELIEEIKPVNYPCIPLCRENDIEIILYLQPEELDNWYASVTQIRKQIKYCHPTASAFGQESWQ